MFGSKATTLVLAATVAVALAIFAGPGTGSSSLPMSACGQIVTTNAVLTKDLDCGALALGIGAGASGITIKEDEKCSQNWSWTSCPGLGAERRTAAPSCSGR